MLVIGDLEDENGTVTPRLRKRAARAKTDETADIEAMSVADITERLGQATRERHAQPFA